MSNMRKTNFYVGMGMGLVVGSCAGLAMHRKKPCAKNALGRTFKNVGEVLDSISGAMGW